MDSTFSTLGFVILGISISFYAFVVESHVQNGNNGDESSSPAFLAIPTPPPPPLLSPPPAPPPTPPLSPPPPPLLSPPHDLSVDHRRSPPAHRRHYRLPPPPPPPHRMNAGKKVGLLFVGIAAVMQVGMAGFLVIKRRQLLKSCDRYENCS
ncbi:hypothetical protein VNO77_06551 [Canavalia gladiata]|uniref:Uncharacterized protein n=1 Tax=Canavalia gladiata TaxID=3824 RepID=A0AAN9R040_CANGL